MVEGLTKMYVNQTDGNITITFPEISGSGDRYDIFERSLPEDSKNKKLKYFELKAETGEDTKPTFSEIREYSQHHPEEVALRAFRQHLNYRLSPEDIGAQILLDFGQYVSQNSEQCAQIFNGNIGGKTKIKVWLNPGESLKSLEVLAKTTKQWEEGIKNETNHRIRDVLHPSFSSKNPVVDIVYSCLLMGATKDFFEYNFSTLCGIPKIQVEGTKLDWEQIRKMVIGLGNLDELKNISSFYDWINETVLNGIIGLYEGKEDLLFWSSLVKYRSMSGDGGESAGWLPSINLYAKQGEILDMNKRWTKDNDPRQCKHLQVPVVEVILVSDNSVGIGNIDPTLEARIGFTSTCNKKGYLKPTLGIDAYTKE